MLAKLDNLYLNVAGKVKNFLSKKHSGFDGLIIVIGLILIAMIIIVIFKLKIQPVMETSIDNTGNQLQSVVDELTSTGGTATP